MTPQYAGLRALHHDVDGLNVLGFPCDQFGNQEPGSAEEIREFVTSNYDIDFPMFAKIDVNGDGQAPLYEMLKAAQPGDGDASGPADIGWNFEKFLVNGAGEVVARWAPPVSPEDIAKELPALLS